MGYKGLREEVEARIARGGLDSEGENLLQGMLMCIEAAGIWNDRYIAALEGMLDGASKEDAKRYREQIRILRHVPENPPADFREAVQMLWSMYSFHRLMGNWSRKGRQDAGRLP